MTATVAMMAVEAEQQLVFQYGIHMVSVLYNIQQAAHVDSIPTQTIG